VRKYDIYLLHIFAISNEETAARRRAGYSMTKNIFFGRSKQAETLRMARYL